MVRFAANSTLALGLAVAIGLAPAVCAPPALAAPQERLADIPGPKRTIAVGEIQAGGGFDGQHWDGGDALASMLAKVLNDSGRFVVVERTSLAEVLNERQLQASRIAGGTAPPTRMISAQYLLVGSVTEFGAANRGAGLSVGGLNLGSGATGGAALTRQGGKVRIDLRLLDARTGEVVAAFTVSRSASRTGLGLVGNQSGLSAGANAFDRTPLGDASRQALEDALAPITRALADTDWVGRIVASEPDLVMVNAGEEAGLAPGDRLRVERVGRVYTDPDTGEVLSEQRSTLGELVIDTIERKVSRGRFIAAGAEAPQRGDFVVFQGR
jgi:curli biogenesis system outer membrane secretion channel CsgG